MEPPAGHMEALLNVSSHQDTRGLRKLHDSVEAHIRGLEALRVPSQTYGGFLTSSTSCPLIIVTREMTELTWDLQQLMKIFGQEIEARERATSSIGGIDCDYLLQLHW